jgi:hypothetical protein
MDREGNVVELESSSFGLPVEYKLLYPERLLHFLDETGCNTNQKSDGKTGGKKYIGKAGSA